MLGCGAWFTLRSGTGAAATRSRSEGAAGTSTSLGGKPIAWRGLGMIVVSPKPFVSLPGSESPLWSGLESGLDLADLLQLFRVYVSQGSDPSPHLVVPFPSCVTKQSNKTRNSTLLPFCSGIQNRRTMTERMTSIQHRDQDGATEMVGV